MQKMAAQPNKRGAITKQARTEISDAIAAANEAAHRHADREAAFEAEYQTERSRFEEIRSEAADLDPVALTVARLAIRPEKENAAFEEIRKAFPEKLPVFMRHDTTVEVDSDLNNLSLERALQGIQQSIQNDRKQVPQRQKRGKAEKLQESK